MKLVLAVCMALVLTGCDHGETAQSLVRTTIGFAYWCQQKGFTESQCVEQADKAMAQESLR